MSRYRGTVVSQKRWQFLGTFILAIAFMLAAWVSPAYAYTLEGPIWASQPPPGTCCATLYTNVTSSESVDTTGWSDARNAWNSSPAFIDFYVSSTTHITTSDTYNSSVRWDGLTTYYSSTGKYFDWATAELNYYYTQNYSRREIQSVAAHELGHVAGLGDLSSGCILMNLYTAVRWGQCGVNTPQSDDVNGIDALY